MTSDLESKDKEIEALKESQRKQRIENGLKKVMSEDKAKILKDLISNPLLNVTTLDKQMDTTQDRSGYLNALTI